MTKLDNQKARFIIWGEALGLDNDRSMYDGRLDDPARKEPLKQSCRLIYKLFTESRILETRYGLKHDNSGAESNALRLAGNNGSSAWKVTFHRMRARMALRNPQRPTYGHVVRWIIKDQRDFLLLVKDLRELIDDLESLTAFRDIRQRQEYITTYEIESIPDDGSIQKVEESSAGDEGLISVAASLRVRSLTTSGATQSFHTAYESYDAVDDSKSSLDQGPQDKEPEKLRNLKASVHAVTAAIAAMQVSDSSHSDGEAEELKSDKAMKAIKNAPSSRQQMRMPQQMRTPHQMRMPQHMRVMDSLGPGSTNSSFTPFGPPSPEAVHARQILEKIHVDNIETCRNWTCRNWTCRNWEPCEQAANAPPWLRSCWKELQTVAKTDCLDAHEFVTLAPIPCAGNNRFRGTILGPELTPYEAGVFHVAVLCTSDYPWKPPLMRFLPKVYHPNVDPSGRICADILGDNSDPAMTVPQVLIAISSILADPQTDDPYVPEIASTFITDRKLYDDNAKAYTQKYATGDVFSEAYETSVFNAMIDEHEKKLMNKRTYRRERGASSEAY